MEVGVPLKAAAVVIDNFGCPTARRNIATIVVSPSRPSAVVTIVAFVGKSFAIRVAVI